jgi:hypothetical protein
MTDRIKTPCKPETQAVPSSVYGNNPGTTVSERVFFEVRAAIKRGHGIAMCGASLECYRCGASGTVHSTGERDARKIVFVGSLAAGEGCRS